jgi:Na+-driven multidrug efflux pump
VGPFPRLGVAGAAVGTIIGRSVGAAVGVSILLRGHHRVHCRFGGSAGWVDFPLVRRMLNVGLPAAAQGLFRNGARVLFFTVVAGSAFRAAAAAALTVGQRVIMITQMPSLAFQVAAAALVGQSIGAKDWKQAEGFGWETVKLCGVIMTGMAAVQWLASSVIMFVFTDDPQVVALGATLLRYFALAQIFSSIAITSAGALVGAGDTRPALYYTILGQWVVMLPLAWLLMRVAGFDPEGAWMAWTVAQVVQMALTLRRFRSGKWKAVRVWGPARDLASDAAAGQDEAG